MHTYIALLRGINVSGQKKINMAELRAQLAELDLHNIRTYIQSGNIVFGHTSTDLPAMEQLIRDKIREKYGFDVPTLVKTPEDFAAALRNNPWKDNPEREEQRLYLTFLAEVPAPDLVAKLAQMDHSPEAWALVGKDIYFFSPQGYGRAKMSNNYFEQKLKVAATTRNWNTVNKLLEMTL